LEGILIRQVQLPKGEIKKFFSR